eukprot:57054_1
MSSKQIECLSVQEIKDILSNCSLTKQCPNDVILELVDFCYYPRLSDLIKMYPNLITQQTVMDSKFPSGWFEPVNDFICKKINQENARRYQIFLSTLWIL